MSDPDGISNRKAVASHVRYELMMLRNTVNEWIRPTVVRPKGEPWRGSALLDSALLHLRSLYDFLARDSKRADDAVAAHFVKTSDGASWQADMPFVASLITRIHGGRHHITYRRVNPDHGPWTHEELDAALGEVEAAYAEFISLLPDSDRHDWQV